MKSSILGLLLLFASSTAFASGFQQQFTERANEIAKAQKDERLTKAQAATLRQQLQAIKASHTQFNKDKKLSAKETKKITQQLHKLHQNFFRKLYSKP